MANKLLKEIARDLLALGGIPFYVIVLARASIGEYNVFVFQLLLAVVVLYALYFFFRKMNLHIARSTILLVFTSLFYTDITFSAFAAGLWVVAVFALIYLKAKPKAIAQGIAFGAISAAASYYLTPLLA